jgi:CRP-like cAMP-binding protein
MPSNRILSRLSRQEFALLEPHLEAVDLPVRKTLEVRRKRIDQVYFIESGFASVVANGTNKPSIEVGIIGREGMREADERSMILHRAMLRYAHAFLLQTTTTALANGRSKIEERAARWLLMADDRIDGDDLPLTHEFLGLMLGTHRPGVTIALQALEKAGLITTRRSHITIIDRKGLEKSSNGTYIRSDR